MMAENTYENHKAAVRRLIRQTYIEMMENTGQPIWVHLHVGKNVLIGATEIGNVRQKRLFQSEPRMWGTDYETVDTEPEELLLQLDEFDNHDAIFEIDPVATGKDEINALCDAGALVFHVVHHPKGEYACAGFYDAQTALEFRLGEHGHILLPMQPD